MGLRSLFRRLFGSNDHVTDPEQPEEHEVHPTDEVMTATEGAPASVDEQKVVQRPVVREGAILPPEWPYLSSEEHLWDELCRVEQFVRAHVERWRLTLGESKPERLWGMIHVTAAEVARYLDNPCELPDQLPIEITRAMQPHWHAAAQIRQRIEDRRALTAQPLRAGLRVDRLQHMFGLDNLDRDVLLVCLLPELDGRYRRLYGYLQDDASRSRPTVELTLEILHPVIAAIQTGRDAFDARSRLLAHHLLDVETAAHGNEPLPMRSVRIDDRIAGYLLGSDMQDGRLDGVMTSTDRPTVPWEEVLTSPGQRDHLVALAGWWQSLRDEAAGGLTLFLHGPYGSGRLKAARAICTASDTPLLVADLPSAERSPHGFELMVDLAYRESILRGAAIYWANVESLLEQDPLPKHWDYLVAAAERHAGLTFLASDLAWDPAGRFHDRQFVRVSFAAPGYQLRRVLWDHYLQPPIQVAVAPDDLPTIVDQLANGFQFTEGQIIDSLASARDVATQREPGGSVITIDDLFEGCRRQSSRHLNTFARRVAPGSPMTFEQLSLPGATKRQIHELLERVRDRGEVYAELGFRAPAQPWQGRHRPLYGRLGHRQDDGGRGDRGRELGVDLFKVDLSAVVSKYIGETEKNLSRVFDDAEGANAMLFFDEADALFGKRSEVKDAHDRYANIEVAYLLQRMEEYAGRRDPGDEPPRRTWTTAFTRRMHLIVDFPFPDEAARRDIWRGMFPAGVMPPSDEDLDELARQFSLAGGSIRNVVLDATFRALAARNVDSSGATVVTLRRLILAIAREYQKQGKPLTQGDFGERFYEWIAEDVLMTPAPDERQRARVWREAFPADVVSPPAEVVSALADRYPLRPHAIRTVVDAAVQSARASDRRDDLDRVEVEQRDLVDAISAEYRRQDRPVPDDRVAEPSASR